MSGPHGFWQVMLTWYSKIKVQSRNPKLRTKIEPEWGEHHFFGHHLNLGAKFRIKKELLCLTKLCKKFRPLGICFINIKSMPMKKAITIKNNEKI